MLLIITYYYYSNEIVHIIYLCCWIMVLILFGNLLCKPPWNLGERWDIIFLSIQQRKFTFKPISHMQNNMALVPYATRMQVLHARDFSRRIKTPGIFQIFFVEMKRIHSIYIHVYIHIYMHVCVHTQTHIYSYICATSASKKMF